MKVRYFIILFIIVILGCKDEIPLNSVDNRTFLVVEGLITNEPGPYLIKLSSSSALSKPQFIPYTDCSITIYDNNGNSDLLTEKEPGIYYTSDDGIKGIVGNEYKITIVAPDGNEYCTDFQAMKENIGIDSLYAQYTEQEVLGIPYSVPAYQFFIDTEIAQNRESYFLWTITEAYEYDVDREIQYIETLDQWGRSIIILHDTTYTAFRTCWKIMNLGNVFTGKTNNLNTPVINHQPLHVVTTETKKLTKRYGIVVNQYIIDEQAYVYWNNIQKQSSDVNFINSTQPLTIRGNIKNVDIEEDIVLGYFTVASVSREKLFVNALAGPFYYSKCIVVIDEEGIVNFKEKIGPPWFFVESDNGVVGITYPDCIDCRTDGGSIEKPNFWID
ncbi:MAG: DUF4249 domain-containing protein [Bacteroidales bacterium]